MMVILTKYLGRINIDKHYWPEEPADMHVGHHLLVTAGILEFLLSIKYN